MTKTTKRKKRARVEVERPVTFVSACGGVMMDPSVGGLPAAYFDDERKLIYIDRKHKKDAQRILQAKVTNSGRWVFLIEDEEKEAEERDEVIPYFDPVTGPKVGDTQVFPNRR